MQYFLKARMIHAKVPPVYTIVDTLEHPNQNELYEFIFYSKIPEWFTTKKALLRLEGIQDTTIPDHWSNASQWITKPKGKHDPHVSYRLHVQRVIDGVPTKVST